MAVVQIKVNVGGGGGGATHIATKPGLLSELENYKTSEIIIAAGGGGGANVVSVDTVVVLRAETEQVEIIHIAIMVMVVLRLLDMHLV